MNDGLSIVIQMMAGNQAYYQHCIQMYRFTACYQILYNLQCYSVEGWANPQDNLVQGDEQTQSTSTLQNSQYNPFPQLKLGTTLNLRLSGVVFFLPEKGDPESWC